MDPDLSALAMLVTGNCRAQQPQKTHRLIHPVPGTGPHVCTDGRGPGNGQGVHTRVNPRVWPPQHILCSSQTMCARTLLVAALFLAAAVAEDEDCTGPCLDERMNGWQDKVSGFVSGLARCLRRSVTKPPDCRRLVRAVRLRKCTLGQCYSIDLLLS